METGFGEEIISIRSRPIDALRKMNRYLSTATAITFCFVGACAVVCEAGPAAGSVNRHACSVLASSKSSLDIYVCASPTSTVFGIRNGVTERLNIRGVEGHKVNNKAGLIEISLRHILIKYGDELAESYTRDAGGIEQKFVLLHRDTQKDGKPALVMQLAGTLRPVVRGDSVIFNGADGLPKLRWSDWKAYDATHRRVPLRLVLVGQELEVHISDRLARYPVVIDPLFAETTPDFTPQLYFQFGQMSRISSDGQWLLIGAFNAPVGNTASATGRAYLFHLQQGSWQQVSQFSSPTANFFGMATAISSDGSQLLIGTNNRGNPGLSYFYKETGNQWSQIAEFNDPDNSGISDYGQIVALAANGTVALVGAPEAGESQSSCYLGGVLPASGKVYIYVQTNGTWSQTQVLHDPYVSSCLSESFGYDLALSADGGTLLIGTYGGHAYVYKNSGGTWTLSATLVQPPQSFHQNQTADNFGSAVALTADGNIAVVGASAAYTGSANSPQGEVFAFQYISSAWTALQEFDNPDKSASYDASDGYGGNVAISNDGSMLAISANRSPTDIFGNPGPGQVYLYKGTPGLWVQSEILNDPNNTAGDAFGTSIGLSADGSALIAGASTTSLNNIPFTGAAYVYGPAVSLPVTFSASASSIQISQPVTFTFTVTNQDPSISASNVTLSNTLSANLQFVSSSSQCIQNGGAVICNLGPLSPGASARVSLTLRGVAAGSGTDSVLAYSDYANATPTSSQLVTGVTVNPVPNSSGGGGGFGDSSLIFLICLDLLVRQRKKRR